MKKTYVIATAVGGVIEHPHFDYQDIEYIRAKNEEDAIKYYKNIHPEEYWQVVCLGIRSEVLNMLNLREFGIIDGDIATEVIAKIEAEIRAGRTAFLHSNMEKLITLLTHIEGSLERIAHSTENINTLLDRH